MTISDDVEPTAASARSRRSRVIGALAVLGAGAITGIAIAWAAPALGTPRPGIASGSPPPGSSSPSERPPPAPVPVVDSPAPPNGPLLPVPDLPTLGVEPPPSPPTAADRTLVAIQFVSPTHGWAVGDGLVVRTVDGGAHWVELYTGAAQFGSLDFVDDSHGWVSSSDMLMAAEDGGSSWEARSEPSDAPLLSVHFVDRERGWGIARKEGGGQPSGMVVTSLDGGRTWARQGAAPPEADSVCFADAERGWLSAGPSVYRSTDGGEHWTQVVLPMLGSSAQVQCAGPNDAWVLYTGAGAGGHLGYAALHLGGGGWTWSLYEPFTMRLPSDLPPQVHPVPGPWSEPGPFSAIDPSTAVFLGDTPSTEAVALSLVSHDGTSVGPARPIPLQWPRGTSFVSTTRGWVVGGAPADAGGHSHLVILATTDGGRTWQHQYTAFPR